MSYAEILEKAKTLSFEELMDTLRTMPPKQLMDLAAQGAQSLRQPKPGVLT